MTVDRPRYFHGGVGGMYVGDMITPGHAAERHVDGCPICAAHAAGISTDLDPLTPENRVYVTTDKQYARWYASRAMLGWLYVVEPIGELTPSDEDQFPTWWCVEAKVLSVYERAIRFTHPERRRLFRRWGGTDREYDEMVASIYRAVARPNSGPKAPSRDHHRS